VIAITLSAGGLAPLRRLIQGLRLCPAAIVIAQHAGRMTLLPQILATDTDLPITVVTPGTVLHEGGIYVCPAQQHVIVNPDGTLSLSSRDHLHGVRPSGDWLFESAAASFCERVVGVILSGMMNDGSRGAAAIRAAGGVVIVQDPLTCNHPAMPNAAIATGAVNAIASPDHLSRLLLESLRRLDLERSRGEWESPFASDVSDLLTIVSTDS
jgi:two-component system chemotaxis response regulator CheB